MSASKEIQGIYSWSHHEELSTPVRGQRTRVEIDDETWRDGMQGTQVEYHPSIEQKCEYLRIAARSGYIDHVDIGFPANSPAHRSELIEIINSARRDRLNITFSAAGRGAKIDDVRAILEVAQKIHEPLEADLFLDVSKLRSEKEGWNRNEILSNLKRCVEDAKKNGLPVMFVPERASVTPPEELDEALLMVADLGVDRIAIADTTGVLTPQGTSMIFRHVFNKFGAKYPEVKWDFHEHNDLGMGIANCVVAASEGVDRLHATSRGIGERAGNVELEQLVVVLNLQGYREQDTKDMQKFAQMASQILSVPILSHEPIVGPQWPETGSGVHASSMGKDLSLYLPFDPTSVGLEAHVRIGPMSGLSNVYIFCKAHGIWDVTEEKAREVLDYAQYKHGILTFEDVQNILGRNGAI